MALVLLFAAGIDPWRWWSDYKSRSEAAAVHNRTSIVPTGPVAAVQPQPVGTDSSVSATRQPLILTEIRRGRNAREGYVNLGVNRLTPQTYRAGAVLANGARIEEIHSDYIILEKGGQRSKLYLETRKPLSQQSSTSSLLFVGGAEPAARAVASTHDALTDFIRVTPIYQGDAVRAIEVYSNERSNVFSSLGLEPGDRITSINGEAVKDAAGAIASLRRLTQGEAMQVTIERQGALQTLSLDGLVMTTLRSVPTG